MSPIPASPFTPCFYCLITRGTVLARTNPCPLHPPSQPSTPSSPEPESDTQIHLWHTSDSDPDEPHEAASIEHQGMRVVCPEPVRRKELVRGVIEGWDRRLKREGGWKAAAEGWERRMGRGRREGPTSVGERQLQPRPAPPRIIITPPDEDQSDVLSTPSSSSSSSPLASSSPRTPSVEDINQGAEQPRGSRRISLGRRRGASVSSEMEGRSIDPEDTPTVLSKFVESVFQPMSEIDESEGESCGMSEEEQKRVSGGEEVG
ncbi:hypothetical protein IAT38_006369 [Cryptococcus sp. DSM 104549]